MIKIGRGAGPEVIAFLAVGNLDGTPVVLDPDALPIEIFTGLTAMFGTSSFPCEITDVQGPYPPPVGLVGFTVELKWAEELARLATMGRRARCRRRHRHRSRPGRHHLRRRRNSPDVLVRAAPA